MKTMTKLPFVVAAFAVLATGAALADDQQLQERHNRESGQIQPRDLPGTITTTVAAYAGRRGVGQREEVQNEASAPTHFEWRHNSGGGYGVYVQGQ
jgi:hypothetical protein